MDDESLTAMLTEILMPRVSPAMSAGRVARWFVAEGDRVEAGTVVAEIATEGATMEVEARTDGVVARLLVPAGASGIAVDRPIALIAPRLAPDDDARHGARGAAHLDVVEALPSAGYTMREALREALAEEMRRDGEVFLIGEEVADAGGAHGVTLGLLAEFGERRVVATPSTPHAVAGLAVGAAMAGLRPVVEVASFALAMQAMDHIVNSAAKARYRTGGALTVPLVLRGPNGAAPRVGAQHAQCLASWFAAVPGLKVVAPSNPADAKGLLKAAIRDPDPVLVLEHEMLYDVAGPAPAGRDHVLPIGKATVARAGRDVTLVGYSRTVGLALDAANVLAGEGIEAEVVDLVSLRPLDIETVVASVRRTNRVVIVEDAWPVAAVGAEIAAAVTLRAFDHLDAPPARITGADVPMPYAETLERLALPTASDVLRAAKEVLYVRG